MTIPQSLIDRLEPLGPHFIRVAKQGKNPIDKGWTQAKNMMHANDPKLQKWLAEGGNYGVVGGYGLVTLDSDIQEIKDVVEEKLPETFTVETPGSKGRHSYYLSGLEKPIRLRDKDGENVGDVQAGGKMVVGPGCHHPSGGVYKIIKDVPFARVTKDQLIEALKPYVIPEKEILQIEHTAQSERHRSNIDINILDVVPLSGLQRRGDEYFGPHPVHGSTTGKNFHVNPQKNCFYCFRHMTGGGPLTWIAIEEGLINCEDALPGALRGPVFKQVLKIAVERGLIDEDKLKKPVIDQEPIVLSHLNMIEDPDLAGKPVIVEAVVSSTSIAYLAPTEIEATREDKDGKSFVVDETIGPKDELNIKLVGVSASTKDKILKGILGLKDEYIHENSWRSVYKVRVRPPVFTLEKRGEKIVDERGFEYKAFDIFITSDKPLVFHPSSLIRVEGIPLPTPRDQKITFLAYGVGFPEEVQAYDVDKLKRLQGILRGKAVKQRVDWILKNFERYSQIVGRRNLAQAALLDYFTPTWVQLDGDVQKGWGNIVICGDTTTAKSETLRKLINLLKAGMLVTAETATTVGLTGTTTQAEGGSWFVDWGFLVLLDRRLLAVDGAHKLSLHNWSALAEAERSGVVSIAKAAKDTAYARTRQIKIANAVDPDAGKYSTKSLANFLYPCQALTTILDKTSIARLDLAVFADQRDVEAEKINVQFDEDYDEELTFLGEALKWCWSNLAEVEFTKEAVKKLLEEATSLYNTYFCEIIPLASIDFKWKLARLSTALAYLTLSTEDFSTVRVTEDHVEEVVNFIRDQYSKAGLNTLAQETKFERLTEEDVLLLINKIVEATKGTLQRETVQNIFGFIVIQGRVTKEQLKTKFNLAENNEARPLLAALSNEKLTKVGRGFYPTSKLVEAYKILNTINRVNTLTGGPPPKKVGEEKKIEGGSYFEPVKGVNRVKIDIVECVPLDDDSDYGTCCMCNRIAVLSHQIEDHEKNWGLICQDCGVKVAEKLRREETVNKIVKCPKCGADTPEAAAFCRSCGWRLPTSYG